MRFLAWVACFVSAAVWLLTGGQSVAETNSAADFREVYDLIHAHVPGADEATLDHAALQGLLSAFRSKVQFGTNAEPAAAGGSQPLVTQSRTFDESIAYFRVSRVSEGLDREISAAWQRLKSTNSLKGIVLDLRYTTGTDYSAAAAVADLFTAKVQPLLNFGNGMISSREKTNAIGVPVAVLVNAETSGAAEALAAMLRETGAGLILGQRTAGAAMIMESFKLKDGEQLRIASAPIHLGDGAVLSGPVLNPDIFVTVSPGDESAYFADPFGLRNPAAPGVRGASTNLASSAESGSRRGYMNEAELVREHRLGLDGEEGGPESPASPRKAEAVRPMVKDPVLARALDLLKGLAVVRQDRF